MAKNAKSHLQARTDFLHRAAKLLAQQQLDGPTNAPSDQPRSTGLPSLLAANMRTVAKRGQIRLDKSVKQSFCKVCDTILVPGSTATVAIDNESKGATKPWADVRVTTCSNCGCKKRLPLGAKRQQKKVLRKAAAMVERDLD